MLRIGRLELAGPLLLAPLAGHTDLPMRLTARSLGGVGMAFTDLICPHAILRPTPKSRWLTATCPDDRPLGVQLYGQDVNLMAEAARWAADQGAACIDINMGCPADKVTKTFAGAMMLCTPDHTVEVAQGLVRAVGERLPVTAKLRLGYRQGERTAGELAKRLIGVGIACITIHGRTAAQRFKGSVDLAGIAQVVAAVHEAGGGTVPCIGNGDVRTPMDAVRMMRATGCDGVMIGRAALGAPWIFRDADGLIQTGQLPAELTLRQRIEVVARHFRLVLQWRDERRAVMRLRQRMSEYARHLGPCKPLRRAVEAMRSEQEFEGLFATFLEEAGEAADRVPISWQERDEIFQKIKETAGNTGGQTARGTPTVQR